MTNVTAMNAAATNAATTNAAATNAAATNDVMRFQMPYAFTLTDIRATLDTAGTTDNIVVDVHDAGTTIMTTDKLEFDATNVSTTQAGTPPVLPDTSLAADAFITVDWDNDDGGNTGAGLTVYLIGHRTLT